MCDTHIPQLQNPDHPHSDCHVCDGRDNEDASHGEEGLVFDQIRCVNLLPAIMVLIAGGEEDGPGSCRRPFTITLIHRQQGCALLCLILARKDL